MFPRNYSVKEEQSFSFFFNITNKTNKQRQKARYFIFIPEPVALFVRNISTTNITLIKGVKMQQSKVINNVKDYVNNQLVAADLSLDGLVFSGLIGLAGCGLSPSWFNKLLADRGRKITSMQLIGLRRLFGDPVDTIIGVELYEIKNPKRMAGLKRIRYELSVYRPKTQKDMCKAANCSHPIIARIERASLLAVRERWADIDTDAEKVYSALLSMETFSVNIVTRLKFSLHVNIDDIMGLGDYHVNCVDEIDFRGGKLKELHFHQADLDQLSPQQRKHPEQVFSPITVDDDDDDEEPSNPEPYRTQEASAELLAQFARNRARASQTDSDTVTGFIPKGAGDE